jgi:hypothetical protein
VQCTACAHLFGANSAGQISCKAYPGGIPNRIVYFGEDHRKESRGDGGIRFMQADTDEARRAFALWQFVFRPEEVPVGDQEAGSQERGDAA